MFDNKFNQSGDLVNRGLGLCIYSSMVINSSTFIVIEDLHDNHVFIIGRCMYQPMPKCH